MQVDAEPCLSPTQVDAAMAAARDILRGRRWAEDAYKARIRLRDGEISLTLSDKNAVYRPGQRGNVGSVPGVEIHMDATTLQVLKQHLVR